MAALSKHKRTEKPFPFMALPVELRMMVYHFLPIQIKHVHFQNRSGHRESEGSSGVSESESPSDESKPEFIETMVAPCFPGVNILATCRVVNKEARNVVLRKLRQIKSQSPKIFMTPAELMLLCMLLPTSGVPLIGLVAYDFIFWKYTHLLSSRSSFFRSLDCDFPQNDDGGWSPKDFRNWLAVEDRAVFFDKAAFQLTFQRLHGSTRNSLAIITIAVKFLAPDDDFYARLAINVYGNMMRHCGFLLWLRLSPCSPPAKESQWGTEVKTLNDLYLMAEGGVFPGPQITQEEWENEWAESEVYKKESSG